MKSFLYFTCFSITVVLMACKDSIYVTVTEPAAVFIEKEYVTAGVLNRSYSSGTGQVIDEIEKGLTLEGKNFDDEGSKQVIQGLFDNLSVDSRFESIVLMDSISVENGGIDVFPAQLSWKQVSELCKINNVQLLFVLEVYDTDTKVNYATRKVTKSTPLGNIPLLQHTATIRTLVKTGWRIYDPATKIVKDEYVINDQVSTSGTGITPVQALAAIMNRGQAVKQVSHNAGQLYASRISVQSFRAWRTYFKGGSANLKTANRRAEVGDWDGASELWFARY